MDTEILLKILRPTDMPAWQDCVWKRQACEQMTCVMCGRRITMERDFMVEEALEQTSIGKAIASAAASEPKNDRYENAEFWEDDAHHGGFNIGASRQFEAEHEVDADGPDWMSYELARQFLEWREKIYGTLPIGSGPFPPWIETEAGRELLWYANLLPIKTGRLHAARHDINRGRAAEAELDYAYTRYVVAQSLLRVIEALSSLRSLPNLPIDIAKLQDELSGLILSVVEI